LLVIVNHPLNCLESVTLAERGREPKALTERVGAIQRGKKEKRWNRQEQDVGLEYF
jgi:hypothetical protein